MRLHVIPFDNFMILEKELKFALPETEKKEKILRIQKIPKELKEEAVKYIQRSTSWNPKQITGLSLHPDLKKRIKEKDLPSGFDMGIDKDGYFVHTHRARCKSFSEPGKIGIKEIKFIDSTG